MILHNVKYKVEKINDIRVSRLCFFPIIIPNSYNSVQQPESHLYKTTLINDKLHVLVKHRRTLAFNNQTTIDLNNDTTYDILVFDNTLVHQNLSYYTFETSANNPIYNFGIKSDITGNTYHIGYTIGNISNNVGAHISFTPTSTSLLRDANQKYSHIFKYNTEYQLTTAITYLNLWKTTKGNVLVNDLINVNYLNYVFITSDKPLSSPAGSGSLYYSKFDNDTEVQICTGDTYTTNNTCVIVKYSDDFKTILWYNKFFGSTQPTPTTWLNNKNILTTVYNDEKSFNIVEDFDKEYIYASVRVDIGCDGLLYTNGISDRVVTNLDSQYYSFVISKFDLDGLKIWAKPIYYTSSHNYNFVKKMIYHNDNIYMTIRTNGSIIVDGVSHGTNSTWKIFVVKIDKNGNFKWVKELGGINNDDYNTDIIIYNGRFGENLYMSGYYNNTTMIDSYRLYSNGTGSYVAKLDLNNGKVVGLLEKTSTQIMKINSLEIIGDSLFICGDFVGGTYIGGNRPIHYKTSNISEIFIEEIKINSI